MVDVEPVLIDEVVAVTNGISAEPDWADVTRRARKTSPLSDSLREGRTRKAGGRRAIFGGVVAFAALVLSVGAVAAAVGIPSNFSSWLTGSPGSVVSPAKARALGSETGAWSQFPEGRALRSLITTQSPGLRFHLYGFRDGDTLCLDLAWSGTAQGAKLSCAPLSALRTRSTPVLVLQADYGVGTSQTTGSARVLVTFGVAAAGVRSIALTTGDRTRNVAVSSNAFLSVNASPSRARTSRIVAVTMSGRVVVSFVPASRTAATAPLRVVSRVSSPTRIDREITGGSIGWLDAREPVGTPLPADSPLNQRGRGSSLVFGRRIEMPGQPPMDIGLYRVTAETHGFLGMRGSVLCAETVEGTTAAGGCTRYPDVFQSRPFSGSLTSETGGQFALISGVTTDVVTRMSVYLADGSAEAVPLQTNSYSLAVPQDSFPVHVVAYDDAGQVIGLETVVAPLVAGGMPPASSSHWKLAESAHASSGNGASLWTRTLSTASCWQLTVPSGSSQGGCVGAVAPDVLRLVRPPTGAVATPGIGVAAVGTRIAYLEVHFGAGQIARIGVNSPFVLLPSGGRSLVEIDAFDAVGRQVARLSEPRR